MQWHGCGWFRVWQRSGHVRAGIVLGLFFGGILNAKVMVLSFHYNFPELIKYQKRCLEKFCEEEYVYHVFGDSIDVRLQKQIKQNSDNCNAIYCRIPQHIHQGPKNPGTHVLGVGSHRHADCIEYAMANFRRHHDDLVVIMDSDLFPIEPFKFSELLEGAKIVGGDRGGYPSAVLVVIDMPRLEAAEELDFFPRLDDAGGALDTGGGIYTYAQNHPNDHVALKPYFNYTQPAALRSAATTFKNQNLKRFLKTSSLAHELYCDTKLFHIKSITFSIRFGGPEKRVRKALTFLDSCLQPGNDNPEKASVGFSGLKTRKFKR